MNKWVGPGAIFAFLEGMGLSERVGGFLIDLDGTVIEAGELIPGRSGSGQSPDPEGRSPSEL